MLQEKVSIRMGRKIEIPNYSKKQAAKWVDKDCLPFTGIMAAVNIIALERFGAFIDELSEAEKDECWQAASTIGLAWFLSD